MFMRPRRLYSHNANAQYFPCLNRSEIFDEDRLLAKLIFKMRKSRMLSIYAVLEFFLTSLKVLLKKLNISLKALIVRFLKEEFDVKDELIEQINNECDCTDDCAEFFYSCYKRFGDRENFGKDFFAFLEREAFSKIESQYNPEKDLDFVGERAREIQKMFNLSEADAKFLSLNMLISDFPRCFSSICEDLGERAKLEFVTEVLDISMEEAANIHAKNSRLFKFNLLEYNGVNLIEINKDIENYIRGYTSTIKDKFYKIRDVNLTYDLDSFNIDDLKIHIALNMLKSDRPCKILLYGKPGSGKTEFAKSLAAACSKKLAEPDFISRSKEGNRRLAAAAYCDYLASRASDMVSFFDECEVFLNNTPLSFGISKSDINKTLDEMRGKSIWICNYKSDIDPSTLRRFDFSIKFDDPGDKGVYRKIHNALLNTKFSDEICSNMLISIVKKYKLNAAGINSMILGADAAMKRFTNVKETLKVMETIAEARATIIDGDAHDKRYSPDTRFDISVINADVDCVKLIATLRNYAKAQDDNDVNGPMSLIFSGVPGSGKTEFAKYIAASLNRDVVLKKMSDLRSKYVGETEANIAAAFKEAEEKKAVLVIDEVDSIIRERSATSEPWEVSETNEILAQMENFRGIFICSTNLLESIDSAAMRRFQKKVKFGYLKDEAKVKLFKKYFTPYDKGELDSLTLSELCRLDFLTPGDFKNVAQQCEFDDTKRYEADYIAMLKREISYKRDALKSDRKIGFI